MLLVCLSAARNSKVPMHNDTFPLYAVGNANRPNASMIGKRFADITIINVVLAADYEIMIVPDDFIPVDILEGRTWL